MKLAHSLSRALVPLTLAFALSCADDEPNPLPTQPEFPKSDTTEVVLPNKNSKNRIFVHRTDERLMQLYDNEDRKIMFNGIRDENGIPLGITHIEYFLESKEEPTNFIYDYKGRMSVIETIEGYRALFDYQEDGDLGITFVDPVEGAHKVIIPAENLEGNNDGSRLYQSFNETTFDPIDIYQSDFGLPFKVGVAWGYPESENRYPVSALQSETQVVASVTIKDNDTNIIKTEYVNGWPTDKVVNGYREYAFAIPLSTADAFTSEQKEKVISETCELSLKVISGLWLQELEIIKRACGAFAPKPACELIFGIIQTVEANRVYSDDYRKEIEEACTFWEGFDYDVVDIHVTSNILNRQITNAATGAIEFSSLPSVVNGPVLNIVNDLSRVSPIIRDIEYSWDCDNSCTFPTGESGDVLQQEFILDEIDRLVLNEARSFSVEIDWKAYRDGAVIVSAPLLIGSDDIEKTDKGFSFPLCKNFADPDDTHSMDFKLVTNGNKSGLPLFVSDISKGCTSNSRADESDKKSKVIDEPAISFGLD
uniref:Lipoprotein n=1 Tax=Roseihalotalea indica TaxID=2867963 RepID=A0AA49GNK4_9BACT|nr:hypothetical protein K4G66_18470 [Tunicatimonas sp. TK19036]